MAKQAEPVTEAKPTQKVILVSSTKTISILSEIDGTKKLLVNGVEPKFEDPQPNDAEKEKIGHKWKRDFYSDFLKSHFENLIIITGAGSSVGWGGKTMEQLWDEVETKLTKEGLQQFITDIGFLNLTKDLEALLSRANLAKEFLAPEKKIAETIKICEKVIQAHCSFELPSNAPHSEFLNKITNRKLKDPRVKLFTLNYDTLFEQAAVSGNFTVMDGFSFSIPRTLSGRNFDFDIVYREKSRIKEEHSFVPRVFHLYKPHGSINWELDKDKNTIVIKENAENPLMIYPKDSKYENSYEQPFFEMMSRFQQNLRNENVLLICIGFSLNDKHIVTAIKEAVKQNPSFRLLIVSRTIRDNDIFNPFVEWAKTKNNVIIVSEEFKEFTQFYPTSKIYSETSDNFEAK